MNRIETLRYTAETHASIGRDRALRGTDGHFDVKLSSPNVPSGGTDSEKLFAVG